MLSSGSAVAAVALLDEAVGIGGVVAVRSVCRRKSSPNTSSFCFTARNLLEVPTTPD